MYDVYILRRLLLFLTQCTVTAIISYHSQYYYCYHDYCHCLALALHIGLSQKKINKDTAKLDLRVVPLKFQIKPHLCREKLPGAPLNWLCHTPLLLQGR